MKPAGAAHRQKETNSAIIPTVCVVVLSLRYFDLLLCACSSCLIQRPVLLADRCFGSLYMQLCCTDKCNRPKFACSSYCVDHIYDNGQSVEEISGGKLTSLPCPEGRQVFELAPDVYMQGWLEKQSANVLIGWQKRWFILTADGLHYYKNQFTSYMPNKAEVVLTKSDWDKACRGIQQPQNDREKWEWGREQEREVIMSDWRTKKRCMERGFAAAGYIEVPILSPAFFFVFVRCLVRSGLLSRWVCPMSPS